MTQSDNNQCWYKIKNDKFKFNNEECQKYGISTDICVECKFLITSLSYQQNFCGSRYCHDCYHKLKEKYKCSICKEEDAENALHKRENIFVDKAMERDLEKMIIKCPDCKSELRLLNLEDHVRTCIDGWDVCQHCQNMFKKNSAHYCKKDAYLVKEFILCEHCGQERRINDKHKCNIDWSHRCPYGCNVDCSIDKNHSQNEAITHLDFCWTMISESGLDKVIVNEETKKSGVWLIPVVEQLDRNLEYKPKDLRMLIDEVSNLKKEMTEEKEINKIVEENMRKQMFDVQNTSFDGTIMWRIDRFSKVKDDAVRGSQKSIFSPPFYSSKFGYKMCLRLYPNGDSSAQGLAMSLFLVIMKGNYDAMLKWPFKQKVTFILLDPEFKTNWIDAFIPSENMSSFSRPRTDMNIPSGSSYFIKFDDLQLNPFKYAKEDTMFIRCIVDCSDL